MNQIVCNEIFSFLFQRFMAGRDYRAENRAPPQYDDDLQFDQPPLMGSPIEYQPVRTTLRPNDDADERLLQV